MTAQSLRQLRHSPPGVVGTMARRSDPRARPCSFAHGRESQRELADGGPLAPGHIKSASANASFTSYLMGRLLPAPHADISFYTCGG